MSIEQIPEKLQDKIRVVGDHWLWRGSVSNPHTYPAPVFCKVPVRRLVWEEVEYLLGRGEHVSPTCAEPMCVNPNHAEVRNPAGSFRSVA